MVIFIVQALSLRGLDETEWISEILETPIDGNIDGNSIVQMHVVEVVAEWRLGLLGVLSRLLDATSFRVHSAECWTRKGRLECVIYVEGARVFTLLWKLRHDVEYFPISTGRFKMIVQRVAAEEFSHLKRRLHNLKSLDLTLPRSSSNIRVHQRKKSEEDFGSAEAVVCLEKGCRLIDVSRNFTVMGHKIIGASIAYPGPYAFLVIPRLCPCLQVFFFINFEVLQWVRISESRLYL